MLTPVKAIRAKCLDCTANQPQEVRLCPCTDCSLYPYRMGKNPNRAGKGGNHGRFGQKMATQVGDADDAEDLEGNDAAEEDGADECGELEENE